MSIVKYNVHNDIIIFPHLLVSPRPPLDTFIFMMMRLLIIIIIFENVLPFKWLCDYSSTACMLFVS